MERSALEVAANGPSTPHGGFVALGDGSFEMFIDPQAPVTPPLPEAGHRRQRQQQWKGSS